jgi:hypothetical protein
MPATTAVLVVLAWAALATLMGAWQTSTQDA